MKKFFEFKFNGSEDSKKRLIDVVKRINIRIEYEKDFNVCQHFLSFDDKLKEFRAEDIDFEVRYGCYDENDCLIVVIARLTDKNKVIVSVESEDETIYHYNVFENAFEIVERFKNAFEN